MRDLNEHVCQQVMILYVRHINKLDINSIMNQNWMDKVKKTIKRLLYGKNVDTVQH